MKVLMVWTVNICTTRTFIHTTRTSICNIKTFIHTIRTFISAIRLFLQTIGTLIHIRTFININGPLTPMIVRDHKDTQPEYPPYSVDKYSRIFL